MSVICKEAYYNSSTGKNLIRALIWHDDKETPIGVFQIAHGVCEHIGRYDDFARFLASNGFVVCGNDHLGHGKSVNSLAELGYTTEENGDVRMVDDMHILTRIMKKRYPELPYFLFGHSMGSFAARIYAADFGEELAGAIFCGTVRFLCRVPFKGRSREGHKHHRRRKEQHGHHADARQALVTAL